MLPINRLLVLANRGNGLLNSVYARHLSDPGRDVNIKVQNVKTGLSSTPDGNRDKLRNIGIVAHINAGKTTTTERILYNAGSTDTVGDVDRGNTVTDYLDQERDRGITITSAAVTFNWRKHRVNLIDTPGHVDFTFEVERSLSVLDGAVTILDASAGVEAQTISVWNQAKKYNLPNIIFFNKCDKPQADIKMCMKDLKTDLDISANLIQLPIKQQSKLSSIVDLIDRNLITWQTPDTNNGSKFSIQPLGQVKLDKEILDNVDEERERLIHNLCDSDENLASHVIECERISDVSGQLIKAALRKATIDCKISPVLVGSAFKYIGVQQLMDAMVDYLPSPIERRSQILETLMEQPDPTNTGHDKDECAFIFKIMHDKRLGPLSYLRIYNGSLSRQMRLENLETGKLEQVKKIYRAFADELKEIETPVGQDDIVVVTGLTESRTGDILVKQNFKRQHNNVGDNMRAEKLTAEMTGAGMPKKIVEPFRKIGQRIIVPKIERLEPVYFCSIEARNMSQQLKLESALACMSREDPSFSYDIDSMGITTIRGMGKLHLEVARDRIKTEHGVESILGRLQISYRETIEGSATEELSISRLINSVNNTIQIKLYVRSVPSAGLWTGKKLRLDSVGENSLARLRNDHRKAIENGFASALMHGPSMGYQMIDCDILLLDFKANSRCGLPVISSAASQCLARAIARCSPVLLEPIMLLEVVAPKDHNGAIVSDLTSCRRGILVSTQARTNGTIVIRSHTPLATLSDYSEFLRITTSGRAVFSMELHSYSAMSETDKQSVVRL
uniref:Ribosome-releasing factor 2, mitochondrial n=1 Tax=Aceria tosichella TaxID=561515 RepID=A0A6G1SLB5_9ACAR